ncbi:MAG: ABC transporter permease [Oscillospiraceae bacterium]|nr:ABC transporter permease [Oscillospiraceae bacterium]
MKQFGKILKFELKSYLNNKTFVGVTLFLVALIAVVMFFPRIAAAIKTEEESPENLPVLLVKAENAAQGEMVQEAFSAAFVEYTVRLTDADVDTIKNQILSGDAEGAFVLTGPASYTYYVNNRTMYDANEAIAMEVLQRLHQMQAMLGSGMTAEQVGDVMNISIQGQTELLGKDQMQNFLYTYIMIMALYMVILLYGQMVAMNVATEKSSRAMEVLITSAKPANMMFGKVLASCAAGLVQLVAIFGSGLLLYNLNKAYWGGNEIVDSIFNIPPELLGYMLVFFLLGFLIYAFLYGAISSTVSKLEDINTAVQPVTYLFLAGFMVVVFSMSSGNVDNLLMKICSYIPFTSPMAMFTRLAMSAVAWYEVALSVGILVGTTVGIGILAAKIYRAGVLMYGNAPKIGTILKTVWRA